MIVVEPDVSFLEGFIGGIQTDAYDGYRFFVKLNPENEHILCWCHVRAKFKLALDISKDKDAGWIHHHKKLYEALLETGYTDRQRIFNSVEVELIFLYLGKP